MRFNKVESILSSGKSLLILLEEKHGTWKFIINNLHDLLKLSVFMVQYRAKENFYIDILESEDPIKPNSISKEDLIKLPEGAVKRIAQQEWDDYEKALQDHSQNLANKKGLESIINLQYKDGFSDEDRKIAISAYKFLLYRSDYEYESITIEEPDSIDSLVKLCKDLDSKEN